MEGRETLEITLPKSKARVVLYTYLTFGERRKIKRVAYDAMSLKVKNIDHANKKADIDLSDVHGGFQLDAEDLTVETIVKEVYNSANERVTNIKQFISDLQQEDGDILYNKVEELTKNSGLSDEERKK